MENPFDVLGVRPGAPPEELAAAYRRQAKRWHPDRGGGEAAERRMAQINAAYDLIRDGGWRSALAHAAAERNEAVRREKEASRPRAKGHWLPDDIRKALGGELITALRDEEKVLVVTPAATWASPTTILAVTDRRLVWLLDDAVGERVQSAPFREIEDIRVVRGRLRRDVASVRVRTVRGRRLNFGELRPERANDIVRRVTQAKKAAA